MKAGRKAWYLRVGKPVLERIQLAIARGDDSRTAYAAFNISQYGCKPRTFRRWCSWLRRELEHRQPENPADERQITAGELLQSLIDSIQITLDAGRKIDSGAVKALQGACSVLKLDIEKAAETRAAELHALKLKSLSKTLRSALDTASENGAKPLTRDAIYDEIDKAMREQQKS